MNFTLLSTPSLLWEINLHWRAPACNYWINITFIAFLMLCSATPYFHHHLQLASSGGGWWRQNDQHRIKKRSSFETLHWTRDTFYRTCCFCFLLTNKQKCMKRERGSRRAEQEPNVANTHHLQPSSRCLLWFFLFLLVPFPDNYLLTSYSPRPTAEASSTPAAPLLANFTRKYFIKR